MSSDPHHQYILSYYQRLLEDLLSKKITLQGLAEKLTQKHLELEERADHDGLVSTFLNNNGFTKALERELKVLKRMNIPGTLLALDIDRLKRFNDTMGHLSGDKLIKTYAQVISRHTRESDLKSRAGGDEFLVFLSNTDTEGAKIVAERIRTQIMIEVSLAFPQLSWAQTISIGLAQVYKDDTAAPLRERADRALYQAKEKRNRIIVAEKITSTHKKRSWYRPFF